MGTNLTDLFIDEIRDLSLNAFPENVVHQAKRCLLDYLGCTLAGSRLIQDKGDRLLQFMENSASDVSVIGFNQKAGIERASFINGLSSRFAELDDGVISGIVHPGSPVLSALLPVAQKEGVKGTALLKGIIVGYEVATRMADAIQPSHKKRGYHATGTCGCIGASLGIAAMLGFSRRQMKDTFSSAVLAAQGSLKVLEDDSQLKPYNVAQAAVGAVLSVVMGHAGFCGPEDVLSGKTGFLSMVADEVDEQKLTSKADGAYAVERVYVEPYAACRYCHAPIDAILSLKAQHDLRPDMVDSIDVSTYALAVTKHDHVKISSISSAKMSIPYSVAVTFVAGRAGIEEYEGKCITDPVILRLAEKVSVAADDELTLAFPRFSSAFVRVHTIDNKEYTKRINSPKGEAEYPLLDSEIVDKFVDLAVYTGRKKDESKRMAQVVWELDDRLHELFDMI